MPPIPVVEEFIRSKCTGHLPREISQLCMISTVYLVQHAEDSIGSMLLLRTVSGISVVSVAREAVRVPRGCTYEFAGPRTRSESVSPCPGRDDEQMVLCTSKGGRTIDQSDRGYGS